MKTTIACALTALCLAAPAFAEPVTAPTPAGTYYLDSDATLWEESNGWAGLQRVAFEDENGRLVPADAQLA